MKSKTIAHRLIVIGLVLFIASIATPIVANTFAREIVKANTTIFCLISVGALLVGMVMLIWGDLLLKQQFFSTKTSSAKSGKPTDPWIEIPKVDKKETKDDVPEIWKDRVLAGGQLDVV